MEANNKATREALEFADRELRMATEDDRYGDDLVYLVGCMRSVAEVCRAALAAPPRNCDRFATVKDAAIAFARERQDAPQPCPDFTFSAWLLAPAPEQKGANNGR